MKKVLFVNFNCYWNPNFETELELMLQHQRDRDKVYSLHCRGELMQACASALFSPTKQKFCKRCQKRYKLGCKLINIPEEHQFCLETPTSYPDYVSDSYKTMEEVKAIQYDNINIGFSMFENIMLLRRAEVLDLSKISKELKTALKISYIVYSNFKRLCTEINPDSVYVFNGKHQEYEPLLSYCEVHNIDYYFHERGANKDRYILGKNCRWHDFDTQRGFLIDDHSKKYTTDDEKLSIEWFENKRKGIDHTWFSFTNDQKSSLLPEDFDCSKKNISFFNSSMWEMINYDSWQPYKEFSDEIEIIKQVCAEFSNDKHIHFYLRIHPHLGWEPTTQLERLIAFKDYCPKNLTIIYPDDKVDTYELITQSDIVVIPFGSTVGVESCYWGTPAILLNKASYQNLDVCYRPQNMAEFISLLKQDNLPPKPKENSYRYGYIFSTFGRKFKYYKAKDLFEGEFLGVNIKNEIKLKNKIKTMLGIKH